MLSPKTCDPKTIVTYDRISMKNLPVYTPIIHTNTQMIASLLAENDRANLYSTTTHTHKKTRTHETFLAIATHIAIAARNANPRHRVFARTWLGLCVSRVSLWRANHRQHNHIHGYLCTNIYIIRISCTSLYIYIYRFEYIDIDWFVR